MKKIYLHMGFHKTATSSFQATCAKNKDKLLAQSYIYPAFHYHEVDNGRKVYNHSAAFISMFGHRPEKYHINIKAQVKNIDALISTYKKQFEAYLKSDGDLIISGEGISVLPESSLIKLKRYLQSENASIIPIICIRSPYAFHCSAAQTKINQGNYVNLTTFSSQKAKILKMQKIFGENIKFISFKEACEHPKGPVAYLLEYCGVRHNSFEFVIDNEGRSNEFIRLQNAMNKQQPIIVDNKLNENHVKIQHVLGKKFLLTDSELSHLQKNLDEENEFYQRTFGDDFCDKKINVSEEITLEHLVSSYPFLFFKAHSHSHYVHWKLKGYNFIKKAYYKFQSLRLN